jgi:hypothetical protein
MVDLPVTHFPEIEFSLQPLGALISGVPLEPFHDRFSEPMHGLQVRRAVGMGQIASNPVYAYLRKPSYRFDVTLGFEPVHGLDGDSRTYTDVERARLSKVFSKGWWILSARCSTDWIANACVWNVADCRGRRGNVAPPYFDRSIPGQLYHHLLMLSVRF